MVQHEPAAQASPSVEHTLLALRHHRSVLPNNGDFSPAETPARGLRHLKHRGKQLSALSASTPCRWQVVAEKRLASILPADSRPLGNCPQLSALSALAGGLGRLIALR